MKRLLPILLILLCAIGFIMHWFYNYVTPPSHKAPYSFSSPHDNDTLHVAFIGDSWAFWHTQHDTTLARLLTDTLHTPVQVSSYGICGQTSKEIYQGLFDNQQMRQFISSKPYRICIVSAGINDTYKKMSTDYYMQSMDGIIDFLLSNSIHPVIIELPDYDIEKAFVRQTASRKALRRFMMTVNQLPVDCRQQYRDALRQLVRDKNYADSIGIVPVLSWHTRDLYLDDGMHLNDAGWTKLDSAFAKVIANTIDQNRVHHDE
jgi:lysophospholipase L1-like esterase